MQRIFPPDAEPPHPPKSRKLQKPTTFGARVSKNHHFSVSLQKPPVHPLTVSRNTDHTFKCV
jgi:hypothetical protein